MDASLAKRTVQFIRDTADKIDAGNSHLSESEAMHIMEILSHEEMSKAQVCKYLNVCRAKFEKMVREKQMPKGRKVTGFTELRWYKDEIDNCLDILKTKQKI